MFTPLTDASADLQAHFRYPENLFQVQASQFATYHVTDPAVFFQKQDVWQIPIDPTVPANNQALEGTDEASRPLHPYYSLMRLPSAADEHFQLILPFTPEGRQNMVSWMAADSDPGLVREADRVHVPDRAATSTGRRRSSRRSTRIRRSPRTGRCSGNRARRSCSATSW